MADEDAGGSSGRESAGASSGREPSGGSLDRELTGASSGREPAGGSLDRERPGDDREDDPGLGFALPPISLPEVRLPERIRLAFPVPDPPEKVSRPVRVEASWVLIAVVLADALDALAVAWAGPEALVWVRAAAGVGVGIVLVGMPGLLYAWELLAIFGGVGWLSLAPTLTALVLAHLIVSR